MITFTPRSWATRVAWGQIDHAKVGVGRRLGEEEAGLLADRFLQLDGVGGLDDRRLHVELREVLLNELARPPVAVAGDDDVPAARKHREKGGGGGAHPRGEENRLLRALEFTDLALDRSPGGVAVAAVFVSDQAPLGVRPELLRLLEPEGGGLMDRCGEGAALAPLALAGVHGTGGLAHPGRVFRHRQVSLC